MTLTSFSTPLPGDTGTMRTLVLGFGWGLLLLSVGGPWCWRAQLEPRGFSLICGPFVVAITGYADVEDADVEGDQP